MKRQFLTVLLLIVGFCSYPQVRGFLSFYESEEHFSWEPRDIVETANGDYLVALRKASTNNGDYGLCGIGKVLKISGDGLSCQELTLEKADTAIYLFRIFPSKLNPTEYIGFATSSVKGENYFLMTMRFDKNLNIVNQKLVELPYHGNTLNDIKLLSLENEYIAAAEYDLYSNKKTLVLYRISEGGDILQSSTCEADSILKTYNLFRVHDRPNCFGLFSTATYSSDASTGVTLFDEKTLQIYKREFFGPWTYRDPNNKPCWAFFYFGWGWPTGFMLTSIPDGDYVISAPLEEITTGSLPRSNRSSIFVKADADFELTSNWQIIGHLNDTVEQPALYQSIDYTSDAVYQCSMYNFCSTCDFPWQDQSMYLVVTKTDYDLNVIWQKRLLLDGDVYTPTNIIATSDGGCLITGMRYNNNEWRIDAFVLKLNADGTYNGLSQPEFTTDESITVYPNPTSNNIVVSGDRLHEVEIYNFTGQKVASYRSANAENFVIDMSGLPSGFYLVNVTSGNGERHVKKVVKE